MNRPYNGNKQHHPQCQDRTQPTAPHQRMDGEYAPSETSRNDCREIRALRYSDLRSPLRERITSETTIDPTHRALSDWRKPIVSKGRRPTGTRWTNRRDEIIFPAPFGGHLFELVPRETS